MMYTQKRKRRMCGLFQLVLISNLVVFVVQPALAQGDDVVLINGREIDTLRYVEYQDSPYQFTDWPRGTIISNAFHRFHDIKLNYNGYTGEFEVRRKKEYIELDAGHYIRIAVPDLSSSKTDTLLFQRGVVPGKPGKFVQLLYLGDDHLFFKTYEVELKMVSSRTVGGVVENKRFVGKFNYFLMLDGKMMPIKLRKKKIIQLFSKPKLAEQIIAREKINCEEEEGMKKLLRLIEQTESQ